MSINTNAKHPYSKFDNDASPPKNLSIESPLNVKNIKHEIYYVDPTNTSFCYCKNPRFKWCNIHWKCCCCKCRLSICMLAFWIFFILALTFLLVVAYLGGYIFQIIPKKPSCCDIQKGQTCKEFHYDSFDKILSSIVKQGTRVEDLYSNLVDYKQLNKNSTLLSLFNEYITNISKFDVSTLDCTGQFTFYINTYNAFAIKMILDHKQDNGKFVSSITDITQYWGLRSVWKMNAGKIGGVEYTLDNIEHDTLRKYFNDSRLHSCIVCASLSCPDIRNEAYKPTIIQEQLLSQFRIFTNNTSKGLKINGDDLELNMIFGWYQEDFTPNVKSFISRYVMDNYTAKLIDDTSNINYFEYNWDLNIYTPLT